jgi:hypothetical protein
MISLEHVPKGFDEVVKYYGNPVGKDGKLNIAWYAENVRWFDLQDPMVGIRGEEVTHLLFHRFVGDSAVDAFAEAREIMSHYPVRKPITLENMAEDGVEFKDVWPDWNQTAGTFCFRFNKNTPTQLSTHSWAIAVDLNSDKCPNGTKNPQHPAIVECFAKRGWVWINPFDNQHTQCCTKY